MRRLDFFVVFKINYGNNTTKQNLGAIDCEKPRSGKMAELCFSFLLKLLRVFAIVEISSGTTSLEG